MQNEKQSKYAAQNKWRQKNRTTIRFDLFDNNRDMIDWLQSQPNMTGYIKDLIRQDMDKNQKED